MQIKTMDFNIREMMPADMDKVIEIYAQAIHEGQSTFDTEPPTVQQWNQDHLKEARLLAALEDRAVGWAALSLVSKKKALWGLCEVSVYLDKDFRGKGLGQKLLSALLNEADNHGFWSLQAAIFPENQASIALHQKLGFGLIGKRKKMGFHLGRWRDVLLFERINPEAQS